MKTQKVWFITGASKGIGFEIAKAALNAGQKVVATVRSKAEELKSALPNNEHLEVVTLDVTNEAAVICVLIRGFVCRLELLPNYSRFLYENMNNLVCPKNNKDPSNDVI